MFKITNKNIKNVLGEIIQRLDQIEVKGASVEHLFIVRMGIKQILDSLEEVKEEEGDKNK